MNQDTNVYTNINEKEEIYDDFSSNAINNTNSDKNIEDDYMKKKKENVLKYIDFVRNKRKMVTRIGKIYIKKYKNSHRPYIKCENCRRETNDFNIANRHSLKCLKHIKFHPNEHRICASGNLEFFDSKMKD